MLAIELSHLFSAMLCGEQNKPYLSSKYWVLFGPQTPHGLPLKNLNVVGISLSFTGSWENAKRFFPHKRDFADQWMKGDKVDCNFCFWQKLFGFSSHKSLDRESASGNIGGLPRAPKLTNSFKETTLPISRRHHIHSWCKGGHQLVSLLGAELSLKRIFYTRYTRRRNVGG